MNIKIVTPKGEVLAEYKASSHPRIGEEIKIEGRIYGVRMATHTLGCHSDFLGVRITTI